MGDGVIVDAQVDGGYNSGEGGMEPNRLEKETLDTILSMV